MSSPNSPSAVRATFFYGNSTTSREARAIGRIGELVGVSGATVANVQRTATDAPLADPGWASEGRRTQARSAPKRACGVTDSTLPRHERQVS